MRRNIMIILLKIILLKYFRLRIINASIINIRLFFIINYSFIYERYIDRNLQ